MESITTYLEPEFDERGRLLISGFDLRYTMTVMLAAEQGPLSIPQLRDRLAVRGFAVRGRPSKTISDALRAEIGKGRAVRVRRGWYRLDLLPKTTGWRIGHHVAKLDAIREVGSALHRQASADHRTGQVWEQEAA